MPANYISEIRGINLKMLHSVRRRRGCEIRRETFETSLANRSPTKAAGHGWSWYQLS